jgi:hypothetical protein
MHVNVHAKCLSFFANIHVLVHHTQKPDKFGAPGSASRWQQKDARQYNRQQQQECQQHTGAAKAGRNNLNTPLLPTTPVPILVDWRAGTTVAG